jgi:hypothetical protein
VPRVHAVSRHSRMDTPPHRGLPHPRPAADALHVLCPLYEAVRFYRAPHAGEDTMTGGAEDSGAEPTRRLGHTNENFSEGLIP